MFLQRIERSNSEDLLPLNIFSPRNRQNIFALSRTKSSTYFASMNYNPSMIARITCCTISAENVKKKGGRARVIVVRRHRVRIKGSQGLIHNSHAKAQIDRSLKRALMSRDLHWVSLRDLHYSDVYMYIYIHTYAWHVSFTWCVTPATRRLLRNYACPPRTTTVAYHKSFMTSKCHSRNSLSRRLVTLSRFALFKKMRIAINSFDAIRHVGFARAISPRRSISWKLWTEKNVTIDTRNSVSARPKFATLFLSLSFFYYVYRCKHRAPICREKFKTPVHRSWIIERLRLGGRPMILLDTREPPVDSPCVPTTKI